MLALFFYRLIFLLLSPLLLIALLLRSRRQKAYRERLLERFGIIKLTTSDVVIHAASVGEVLALKNFIEKLLTEQPQLNITFTTFTPTGSEQVTKLFGDRVQHCYLPLDIWPCTWLFLHTLKPKMLVFMETELWPNLTAQANKRAIKLFLINGRLSEKSYPKYRKLTALITPCLQAFDHILCQSQENQERFINLGANQLNCTVSGNLKYDISLTDAIKQKQIELKKYLPENRPIWLVASTHQGDEDIVLKSLSELLEAQPTLLLILVPRHPERFATIAELASQHFSLTKRSEKKSVSEQDNIWLLDSLGELMAAFSLADIITMGGSFSQIGGHNPLEPALLKKPIITGPDMSNFTEVQNQLLSAHAIIQLNKDNDLSQQLSNQVTKLLNSPEQQAQLGQNAYDIVQLNQGASDKTLDVLQKLLYNRVKLK